MCLSITNFDRWAIKWAQSLHGKPAGCVRVHVFSFVFGHRQKSFWAVFIWEHWCLQAFQHRIFINLSPYQQLKHGLQSVNCLYHTVIMIGLKKQKEKYESFCFYLTPINQIWPKPHLFPRDSTGVTGNLKTPGYNTVRLRPSSQYIFPGQENSSGWRNNGG